MFFEGTLQIDPSELTNIALIKPTKVFKRMMYHLSFGTVADKEERETFTAISILQQLNMAFAQKGVTNIVRLSHDAIDFYLDTAGKTDDIREALDVYELETGSAMTHHFNKLGLVLEHEDDTFKYLIEVDICKNHTVGTYPIAIKITGLLKAFSSQQGQLKKKIGNVFTSQEHYDSFKRERLQLFSSFIEDFSLCFKKTMKVDDIICEIRTKMPISKTKISTKSDIKHHHSGGYRGLYYGYYGFDEYLIYSFMWSSISHEHQVQHTDFHYESETGEQLGHIEEIDSSEDCFDGESDFEDRTATFSNQENTETEDSGDSWFDFGDSFDSSDSDSSSSCSSCSSCGGD